MFQEIPQSRPITPLLDSIDHPSQLRELASSELPKLALELREYLLYSVWQKWWAFWCRIRRSGINSGLTLCIRHPPMIY